MRLAGMLPYVIALATTACVQHGQVRARAVPDLRLLCTDSQYQSLCTPAPSEQPMQVDTNLALPPPANAPFLG